MKEDEYRESGIVSSGRGKPQFRKSGKSAAQIPAGGYETDPQSGVRAGL